MRQPQLSSLSSDAQKETLANLRRGALPTSATKCASVMKEPWTISQPFLKKRKLASSVLMLTASPGAEKKAYIVLLRPRKSAWPPCAKWKCGSCPAIAGWLGGGGDGDGG